MKKENRPETCLCKTTPEIKKFIDDISNRFYLGIVSQALHHIAKFAYENQVELEKWIEEDRKRAAAEGEEKIC